MKDWLNKTHVGDCRALLREMAADGMRVQCVVTSPPYWGLRDYGVAGAIGLEPTLQEWITAIVDVMRAVREVLAENGTLWLNLGDVGMPARFGRSRRSRSRGRISPPFRRISSRAAFLQAHDLETPCWILSWVLEPWERLQSTSLETSLATS